MLRPIRRVVTGHDENGKAVVVQDGPAPNVVTSEHRPGGRTNIWRTTSAPACYGGERDEAAADVSFTLEPMPRGTNFRISEYPPESPDTTARIDGRQAFAEVGAAHRLTEGARHPLMHATETVDYAIVLEGEIVMLLDDDDIPLKAGDVIIQRGTNHFWVNRSDRLCRMAFILIDGVDEDGNKRR
ncbi:MAG: cupin domain-containing protein [Alphaproteobacteria bacterium]